MKLFFHASRLRLTIPANAEHGERTYFEVKPAWAAPMSRPNQYLALLHGQDK